MFHPHRTGILVPEYNNSDDTRAPPLPQPPLANSASNNKNNGGSECGAGAAEAAECYVSICPPTQISFLSFFFFLILGLLVILQ